MKSQTARRPDQQRSARLTKSRKYVKQTAHVEARRDGKPIIFGWGGHLSRSEKARLERRAVWAATIFILFLIVGVLGYFWLNINVITPGLAITTVNGQSIPQSDYRKLLALKTQLEINKLKGPHGLTAQSDALRQQGDAQQNILNGINKQIDDINTKLNKLPAGPSAQRTDLENQLATLHPKQSAAQTKTDQLKAQYQTMTTQTIANEGQLFTQSQIGSESANWLQDDVLIRSWLSKQSNAIQSQVEPSNTQVEKAVKDFIANIPKSSSYQNFLSRDNVSDADVHAMMRLKLRRDNMQTYQASQITTPTYQVHASGITLSTKQDAQNILKQLGGGADFAKLAKSKSLDTGTNTKGGDLGWMARGQYTKDGGANVSATVDNWLFDPARKVNELSPVLSENGTFHIIKITGIDPSRAVDKTTLQALKDNALTAWLLSQKAMPGVTVGSVDQNKLLDSNNMPPDLPASAPSTGAPGGVPGGAPGGIPGGAPGGLPGGAPGGMPSGAPGGAPAGVPPY